MLDKSLCIILALTVFINYFRTFGRGCIRHSLGTSCIKTLRSLPFRREGKAMCSNCQSEILITPGLRGLKRR